MLSLVLFCAYFATFTVAGLRFKPEHAEIHFHYFVEKYEKEYPHEQERQARFEVFKDNLEIANRMNEESDHAEFGITPFMDMTSEEFIDTYAGCANEFNITEMGCDDISDDQIPDSDAPESFDWRDHQVVTRVKNQGKCGSCYAFSATGNIEAVYAIKHKQLLELSEQQIVDCDKNSLGCKGGYMTTAFRTLIQQGGIAAESTYPYEAQQHQCRFSPSQAMVRVTDCHSLNLVSQEKLKKHLHQNGPISIGVKASNFQVYRGGIFEDSQCSSGQVNHAVLLVGYGNENGRPYWLVKNSWGETWGEKGYIKLQRGENAQSCGMMNNGLMATSVVM